MIIHGDLIQVGTYATSFIAAKNERNSSISIMGDFVEGAGDTSRTSANHPATKSWEVRTQLLLGSSAQELSLIYTLAQSMRNGTQPVLAFRFPVGSSQYKIFRGPAVVTNMRMSIQGRNLVQVSFSAVGSGAPTFA